MPKNSSSPISWLEEQRTKSLFFHAKLHEWSLLEIAYAIEQFDGATVEWNLRNLGISEKAWNRIIHRGVAPVRVFAHPAVLQTVPRAVGYYRMLAMVSQKSMKRIHLDTEPYETGDKTPNDETAYAIAYRLNSIVSQLIESEITIDERELDLWRGMAAGSQAQGAWQNAKGSQYEAIIQQMLTTELQERNLVRSYNPQQLELSDGRTVVFGSDPDIRLQRDQELLSAVEVKGGIDPAGAHERLGAAVKTLRDCKTRNIDCATLLVLRKATLTAGLEDRLRQSEVDITRWFAIEELIESEQARSEFVRLFLRED